MGSIIKIGEKHRAQFRHKGVPTQTRTFSTKILAEKWLTRLEADYDAGRTGIVAPSKDKIGPLIDRYTEEVGKAKPFGKNKANTLKLIKRHLGDDVAGELTPERLVDYIVDDREVSGVTASIDLTYLKGVLKVARALWRINVSPSIVDDAREILKHMGLADRSNERDRRPTEDELVALLDWFAVRSETLRVDHIHFILDSCFRPPSEVCRLKWEHLHHEDRTILIEDRKDPRRKKGNNQIVPLINESYDIVMRQPRVSEYIFPVNGKTWSSLFPRACDDLGIVDLTLYDLRHEAISRLVESGKYSIPEMMLITGHKDPKQLMRYTQLRARDLHR
jgi:integrase